MDMYQLKCSTLLLEQEEYHKQESVHQWRSSAWAAQYTKHPPTSAWSRRSRPATLQKSTAALIRMLWPKTVLLTDITYLSYNSTFAYFSTILDTFTKQILAYAVNIFLEMDFVLKTVNILHSDQECHYTSYHFIEILHNKNLCQAMTRKGNCWNNASRKISSAI